MTEQPRQTERENFSSNAARKNSVLQPLFKCDGPFSDILVRHFLNLQWWQWSGNHFL